MKRDKLYPLCDYACPLHKKCCWYLEGINKAEVEHWGKMPYNESKGKCDWFVPLDIEEMQRKINDYLNPKNN